MRRAHVFVFLFAVLSITACRRRAVEGSSVVIGAAVDTTGAEGQCSANIAVGQVIAPAGCTIDQRVSGQSAMLVFPCSGGQAQAAFGDSVFIGSVMNNQVDVAIETSFPFTDGCTWHSKQRISGTLGAPLAYSYEESPEPGQSGCSNGCTASATVQAH